MLFNLFIPDPVIMFIIAKDFVLKYCSLYFFALKSNYNPSIQNYYDFKCLINEKRVHFNQHSTEWHAHVRPYNKSSGKQGNVLKPQQSY